MLHRISRYQHCYCGHDKRKSSSGKKSWEEVSYMSMKQSFSYSHRRDFSNARENHSNSGISYKKKLDIINEVL